MSPFLRLAEARPRLLLLSFCLLCWSPGWFTIPATDRDESRFAQATRQMVESGDLINIRNGTEARNRKPIGIYWLQLPGVVAVRSVGLAGPGRIWPYRIPSLLGALIGVLATFEIGRILCDKRAALLAAAMLAGSAVLVVEAHLAKTDAALLGTSTVAMLILARASCGLAVGAGQAAAFWIAVGAGVLIKGPITPMVAVLAAATIVAMRRRASWLHALRASWGVPLMLALVLPWFVAIGIATHGAFFAEAAGGDLARKLAGGDDAHGAPPGTHLVLLAFTLFPAAFGAVLALPEVWRARRDPPNGFLLAWLVPSWLVFEATPTKLPHYILPLLPALCLLTARALTRPRSRLVRLLSGVSLAAGCAVFGLGPPALAAYAGGPVLLGLPAFVAAGLIAAAAWRCRRSPRPAMTAVLCLVPVLWWSICGLEMPLLAPLWVSARVARAIARTGGAVQVAAVGYDEPSLRFEAGTTLQFLGSEDAARFLNAGPNRVVAVSATQDAAFRKANPVPLTAIASIGGFDYSDGRRITLDLFRSPR